MRKSAISLRAFDVLRALESRDSGAIPSKQSRVRAPNALEDRTIFGDDQNVNIR